MRLINAETMLLEDFTMRIVPQYAILSHTWTEEEVTLQEFTCRNNDTAKKHGFAKITQTCKLARAHHIKYAWVDTCCIDKTSSAELAEAINSMFQWYNDALVCYAYLSDLPQKEDILMEDWSANSAIMEDSPVCYDKLKFCRWFTRGWTLQELIAPKTVHFYDETWAFRGTKDDLADLIYRITHIDPLVLRDSEKLAKLSIAERMTWASRRKTTRIEDTAYCLLGIFDISMSLQYGEGNKAFTRLQQEIIKNNSDLSIFGWSPEESAISVKHRDGFSDGCQIDCGHRDSEDGFLGILAPSPNAFVAQRSCNMLDSAEHSVTHRGIKIYCSLLQVCLEGCGFYECRCCLDCRKYVLVIGRTTSEPSWGIILDKFSPDIFFRSSKRLICLNKFTKYLAPPTRHRAIFLLTRAPDPRQHPPRLRLVFRGRTRFVIDSAIPDHRWNSCKRYWYIEDDSPHAWGMVSLKFYSLGDQGRVCVLFQNGSGRVSVFDALNYRKEITEISQRGSEFSWNDVWEVFDGENLFRNFHKVAVSGERLSGLSALKVRAKLRDSRPDWWGGSRGDDWALEVWTEQKKNDDDDDDEGSETPPPPLETPPPLEENLSPAPGASQPAGSASTATQSPSGSIQAVIVRCNVERRRNSPAWSATTIPADHRIFSQPVPHIPALIEVPLVFDRLGTQSADRSDLSNQIATYLNIDADSGYAPPVWQSHVGTVIVARKDGKALLPHHLEGVWLYCRHILDIFENGEGAPTWMYNRQAFEKWWKEFCKKSEKKDDPDFQRSPYEV
jgi:hypothetical protein